ncbi:hypothetical protein SpCBS45565_g03619 [Spizellomyces sp. 'palustris']|nr:hypothetical protein SpCBS45565_g03619 [Spizellomyces sp. 'palustris']
MTEDDTQYLTKFYCAECETTHGKSIYKEPTRKSKRDRTQINYSELNQGVAVEEHRFTKLLKARSFAPDRFQRLQGRDVTLDWARTTGLKEPIVIESPEGLDMCMPDKSLIVNQVADLCGREREVDVIEVATQSERIMTLDEWAKYFHQPPEKRKRILNVISLEISQTPLGDQIKRPRLVRELDWIDNVWPADLKAKDDYPHVQLYCLMSVKDSYTDFHIDFGGSSVFYHLLSGQKIFYFIEPTKTNLRKYEKWSSSPDQSNIFLADEIKGGAIEVRLYAGNTMIIPTGWIHAVYTPADSVVIGGNFLQGLNIRGQLDIYEIEKRTLVPAKFRFPFFEKMQWYAAKTYLGILKENAQILSKWELDGLNVLVNFLQDIATRVSDVNHLKKEERKALKRTIPQGIKNVQKLLRKLLKHLNAARAEMGIVKLNLPPSKSASSYSLLAGSSDGVNLNQHEKDLGEAATDAVDLDPHPNATIKAEIHTLQAGHLEQAENESSITHGSAVDDDSDEWLSDLTEMEFLDSDNEDEPIDDEDGGEYIDEDDDGIVHMDDGQAYIPGGNTRKAKRKPESESDDASDDADDSTRATRKKKGRSLGYTRNTTTIKGDISKVIDVPHIAPPAQSKSCVTSLPVREIRIESMANNPPAVAVTGMYLPPPPPPPPGREVGNTADNQISSNPSDEVKPTIANTAVQVSAPKKEKKPATVYQRMSKTMSRLGKRR